MPTVGDLRKAKTTDKLLGQTLDEQPALTISKTNPYYKFAQSQQLHTVISKSTPKVKEELTLKAMAPITQIKGDRTPKIKQLGIDPTLKAYPPKYERTQMMTPKGYKYLSKTAGKRRNNKKQTKKNKKNRKSNKRR